MKESGKERFILTKSYEVAYALFRMAGPMGEKDFSEKLRTAGADLLQAVAAENYAVAGTAIQVAECLVKFGGDVNLIGTANAETTLREIYALEAAIAERRNAAKTDEVDVSEIFSKPQIGIHGESGNEKSGNAATNNPAKSGNGESGNPAEPNPAMIEYDNSPAIPATAGEEPNIRQSAILDFIRQSGNCRMKEIQERLPDTSERTLRYDLQTLLERNLIERVGSGGPSVFYRPVLQM